ncbi:ufm1-specific protease 1 [Trichonephila clavipes]|nr:ufm1-specific protease 1 [Trichonephila clavipes]
MLDIKKIYFPPKIQCKIIHCRNIQELHKHVNDIIQHFMDFGSPIMMGSDKDCSSKGILGISETENGSFLLILPTKGCLARYDDDFLLFLDRTPIFLTISNLVRNYKEMVG